MIKKLFRNLLARAAKEFWSSSPAESFLFLILLFLPTQFGKHFWPQFSIVSGLQVDYLSPTLYFTDVLIFVLFFVWIKENRKINAKVPIAVVAFFSTITIGILFSRSPLAGIYYLFKILEFSFLGFYIAKEVKSLDIFVKPLGIGLVFESLLAIAQYLSSGSLGGIFYFLGERSFNSSTPGIANASINGSLVLRPYATFSHPNVLGAFLVFSMTIILFSKISQKISLPILALGTFALMLSLSRTAIVAWIIIAGIHLFKKYFLAFLSFCLLVVFVSPLRYRFATLLFSDEAISQRLLLNKAAWEMFLQKPIFGLGLNNFLPTLPYFEKNLGFFTIQPAHNIFLLVLSEVGILGSALLVFLLAKTIARVYKKKNYLGMFLLTTVAFLGLFDHYFLTLQQGQMMLAVVLGICWSSSARDESDTII